MAGSKKSFLVAVLVVLLLMAIATGVVVVVLYGNQQPERSGPQAPAAGAPPTTATSSLSRELVLMTWNVRGYPEHDAGARAWFSSTLNRLAPDVLCIQEISGQNNVSQFLATEHRFTRVAFKDSRDSQDNAVFGDDAVEVRQLPTPTGFQHPAQVAYVTCGGFDATVVTVHLSWTDKAKRETEKVLLQGVVAQALKTDPDVVVCGDFNTEEPDISALASSCGLKVMVPRNITSASTTHAGHRYDWFLISPDLEAEEAIGAEIVTFPATDLSISTKVSDHLPVRARFRPDERFRDESMSPSRPPR